MCRYSDHNYRTHYICLDCRKTFKHRRPWPQRDMPCPQCGQPMRDAGRDFRAPRLQDRRSWRVVATLLRSGVHFDSCGCYGPGYRPTQPWLARQFVRQRRQRTGRFQAQRSQG